MRLVVVQKAMPSMIPERDISHSGRFLAGTAQLQAAVQDEDIFLADSKHLQV
jgi:hypothetical protein